MNRTFVNGLFSFLLAGFVIIPGRAQGTEKDYERANNLDRQLSGKVWHSEIRPSWIGRTDMLIFEDRTPAGKNFILADATKKTTRKAFDEVKLAAALGSVTGDTIKADDLPVRNISMADDLRSMTLEYSGWVYRCDLRKYTVTKEREARRPNSWGGDGRWPWGFRDESAGRPDTSPDKKMTAFVRDYNVWIRDLKEKKEYQLSYDGGIGRYYSASVEWSPDSRKLMAYLVQPAEKHMISYIESSPEGQVQPRYYTYEYTKPGDAVPQRYPQIFDVEGRKHIAVDEAMIPNQYSADNFSWDSLGKSLTFEYNRRGHQVYRVMRIDAETGKMSVVIDEQSPTFIDYSGKKYRYDVKGTGEIIWASERDGWNHLWLYDGNTGMVKNQVTKGEWVVRGVVSVDDKERHVIFRASGREKGDPYLIHYYRIGFDGTGLTHLTPGEGNHDAVFSDNGKYFVDTWSRVDMPPVSVVRSAADGSEVMKLAEADVKDLLATGWQFPEVFTAKGRDGVTDIWGVIIRPLNFDPSRKYPVIENIYAGPHSSFVPKSFRPTFGNMNSIAELGFIVVQIDGMGTSNRSKKFHDVAWKNIKDAGFPDRILWMKAAAEKYPYMDVERVGIYGTSAGGQNSTGALLFHPEFYDVAVSSCGCHDNRMDKIWWNEQWMGWPVDQSYIESSNVENAHLLKGKLLLINGEMDNNVDPASTTQLVNALIKAGKDFDYLLVPGMQHSSGGAYGERRRMDFFVENLLGVKAPDWNKKEK
ncbi:MAG: S9 family peptidase [Bacteroidales bacterium]|nr:S9 family peptidase [Bacteroidales bacterium]